jgi:hypothetical protein
MIKVKHSPRGRLLVDYRLLENLYLILVLIIVIPLDIGYIWSKIRNNTI